VLTAAGMSYTTAEALGGFFIVLVMYFIILSVAAFVPEKFGGSGCSCRGATQMASLHSTALCIHRTSRSSLFEFAQLAVSFWCIANYLHYINRLSLFSDGYNPWEHVPFYSPFGSGDIDAEVVYAAICPNGGSCDPNVLFPDICSVKWPCTDSVRLYDIPLSSASVVCECFNVQDSDGNWSFDSGLIVEELPETTLGYGLRENKADNYTAPSRVSPDWQNSSAKFACNWLTDVYGYNFDEWHDYEVDTWTLVCAWLIDVSTRLTAFGILQSARGTSVMVSPMLSDVADYMALMSVLIDAILSSYTGGVQKNIVENGFNMLLWFALFRMLRLMHFLNLMSTAVDKDGESGREKGALYLPLSIPLGRTIHVSRRVVRLIEVASTLVIYVLATAALILACEFACPIVQDCSIYVDGSFDADCSCNTAFRHYYQCVYFTIVTFSTVGYGDMYPSTNRSRTIVMLAIAFGITMIPYLLGQLTPDEEDSGSDMEAEEKKTTQAYLECIYARLSEEAVVSPKSRVATDLSNTPAQAPKHALDVLLSPTVRNDAARSEEIIERVRGNWAVRRLCQNNSNGNLRILCKCIGIGLDELPAPGLDCEHRLLATLVVDRILGLTVPLDAREKRPSLKPAKIMFPAPILAVFARAGQQRSRRHVAHRISGAS